MPHPVHWLDSQTFRSACPMVLPSSTTTLLPPPTTALENATNFCHLLRDVEKDQALLLKREDGQQGNPYWHPQAGSTSHIPAWGKGQTPHPAHAGTTTHPGSPQQPRRRKTRILLYSPGDL